MDFWDFFWLMIWTFFFVAYLLVLFQIVADLFRDKELSGWWKALWILFLIFLPVLTALVYLIARGRGMGERQVETVAEARRETESYIRDVASASPADQIASAKSLLDAGTITPDEFERLKTKAMA
ncbi:SHOCT domain-containing protein [Myceligenerans pegani]|uniref:SHOCT domain-containing protein n=2 Tax=Myceligenerans pegani TaxID=2776917 RepID=A0ABR9MWU0_9MICO|nr:SHOCT domain-containing protein [Myceligenerans sp. TRM 65318]MBE1875850.1 SHOCT domain-containing protein [Myceligenerans sp. TRM 65318]MBE3018121.1 SHOCT domain-containing protein [Myceligenerans sp. TRM 65318]